MKILHIVGARPNFIKLAPILKASQGYEQIKDIIVHTEQHYDYNMSKAFFDNFDIPAPDYHLEVGSATHGIQTGQMLERLEPVLLKEKPDVVLVYGDTNTVLAGALASYKLHIPTGHVEAGMREEIWRPEEINKKTADHCSDFLFCPTQRAVECLRKENIEERRIFFTGDTTYDTFLQSIKIAERKSEIFKQIQIPNEYYLLTMHRAETVDHYSEVKGIVEAMLNIEEVIIYPIHPRSKKTLSKFGLLAKLEDARHIMLVDPVGYFDFITLLLNSRLVMTDSGGVLKEAFYALKPCVTLQDTNEYEEIFELGYSILAGNKQRKILNSINVMLQRHLNPPIINPFGDGHAAEKIVKILIEKLGSK